eukprot:5495166-Prymnesium_polylepis.1
MVRCRPSPVPGRGPGQAEGLRWASSRRQRNNEAASCRIPGRSRPTSSAAWCTAPQSRSMTSRRRWPRGRSRSPGP